MTLCNCGLRHAPPRFGRTSRRELFGLAAGTAMGAASLACAAPARAATAPAQSSMSAEEALRLMKDGNAQYRTEAPYRSQEGRERRVQIAAAQHPFCVLVGCSDSRVPPELLFGRGLGELFIVRNAGNTVDLAALGSIEYGVAALGVPLVLVLGHERCGAVQAAVDIVEKGASFPGVIGEMVEAILPAVLAAKRAGAAGDALIEAAVRENVKRVVHRLGSSSQVLAEPLRAGRLKIVGARYDLEDGDVDFME